MCSPEIKCIKISPPQCILRFPIGYTIDKLPLQLNQKGNWLPCSEGNHTIQALLFKGRLGREDPPFWVQLLYDNSFVRDTCICSRLVFKSPSLIITVGCSEKSVDDFELLPKIIYLQKRGEKNKLYGKRSSFPINDESIHYICDNQCPGSSSCQGGRRKNLSGQSLLIHSLH